MAFGKVPEGPAAKERRSEATSVARPKRPFHFPRTAMAHNLMYAMVTAPVPAQEPLLNSGGFGRTGGKQKRWKAAQKAAAEAAEAAKTISPPSPAVEGAGATKQHKKKEQAAAAPDEAGAGASPTTLVTKKVIKMVEWASPVGTCKYSLEHRRRNKPGGAKWSWGRRFDLPSEHFRLGDSDDGSPTPQDLEVAQRELKAAQWGLCVAQHVASGCGDFWSNSSNHLDRPPEPWLAWRC
eukprot:6985739-Prymnesium_polylepis.1